MTPTKMSARQRISFGSQYKFPLKLYEVAKDGLVVKWTEDGTSVVIEQREFEDNVMQLYPGFVQVKSFHNLRRLFRDYNFQFRFLRRKKPHGLKLEFRHNFFMRDNPERVLLLRKGKRRSLMCPLATSSPENTSTRWRRRRRLLLNRFDGCDSIFNISDTSGDLDSCSQSLAESTYVTVKRTSKILAPNTSFPSAENDTFAPSLCEKQPLTSLLHKSDNRNTKLTEDDIFRLAQIYAMDDLSEAEFWEIVARRVGHLWRDKSWDATMNLLTSAVDPAVSPLHHKGFYYEFSFDEL